MKKVLIVDDEKNIQVSLATVLEDEGYQVFFAHDGEDALAKFGHIRPDAVFLDIWLPGIDGLEVLKRMLAIDSSQIVIMISGHGSISAAVSALKTGAYDFLEKPLSLDKVMFVLKRALQYRSLLAENEKLKAVIAQESVLGEETARSIPRDSTGVIAYEAGDAQRARRQRTVEVSNIFYGIGLHSGQKTGMVIKPLPPGKGIRFENISEKGYIPARIEYLDTTSYATSIKKDGVEARTIEHFMAVLHAFGITNLSVKINKEVPIDDGSALAFCDFIQESGVVEQEAIVPEIIIDEPLQIGATGTEGKFIRVEPADVFSVRYTCIYPEPLGRQTFDFTLGSVDDFRRDIAPSRTYGFVDDLNRMSDMGLAEGGRMNNFILIDRDRIINTALRFPDELARHKILDVIGDFYLLGRPIRGRVIAQKTGHTDNAQMVNLIKNRYLDR